MRDFLHHAEYGLSKGLGVLDGVVLFAAASCLFRASQDVQELYFFPSEQQKSLLTSAVIGIALLAWRGKTLFSIIE